MKNTLIDGFRAFVSSRTFPCVGAKSALSREHMEFQICDRLGSLESAGSLCDRLADYSARHPDPDIDPVSFVAIFRQPVTSEVDFHHQLWLQLQRMHDIDVLEYPWAHSVSQDPGAADFSFSIASRAFFVVGLHPQSSRLARRAPNPTLVFNFHEQFEALRRVGRYDKLQSAIRKRDLSLQGNINPLLARFGEASEAHQYSAYPQGGCPFRARSSLS
jgi:uncharacterized protein